MRALLPAWTGVMGPRMCETLEIRGLCKYGCTDAVGSGDDQESHRRKRQARKVVVTERYNPNYERSHNDITKHKG